MKIGLSADELVKTIDTHFAALVLFARQWESDSAEDVVQEAFLQLVRHSHKKGKPENIPAWLFQVVRNGAISRFRKLKRREKHEQNFGRQRVDWFVPSQNARLESEEAVTLLEQLPLEQREIVVMRIWGGLSFDEIAALTSVPRTTVYRKYHETLELLKRKLS